MIERETQVQTASCHERRIDRKPKNYVWPHETIESSVQSPPAPVQALLERGGGKVNTEYRFIRAHLSVDFAAVRQVEGQGAMMFCLDE